MELIHQSLEALSHTPEGTVLIIYQEEKQPNLYNLNYHQIKGLFIWQGEHKLNVFALNDEQFFFGTLVDWEDMVNHDNMWNQLSQTMKSTHFFPNYLVFQFLDDVADLMSVGEYTQYPPNKEQQQRLLFIEAVDKWQSGINLDLLPKETIMTNVEESENFVSVHVKFK